MLVTKLRCINKPVNPTKRILLLGKFCLQENIITELMAKKCYLDHTEDQITEVNGYDLVVSFGYRHVIKQSIIEGLNCPVFNLHISYLPYNRGAHPNFWSFADNTPSGVSIHLVDKGVDTGPIVYQKIVTFAEIEKTFSQTYTTLIREIETLFINNLDDLLRGSWTAKPQIGKGSHHFFKDLPESFSGWSSNIKDELRRLGIG